MDKEIIEFTNNDPKTDYLIKTFSRTRRKDYENYVLNAIWHRLNNMNIKPITQQYVRRGDGTYALLDLYFPQLNIAVECDEAYHMNNVLKDTERQIDVENALSSIDETAGFEIYRVAAYETIDKINSQIEEIVNRINIKYIECGSPIWNVEDPVIEAGRKGVITTKDDYQFKTIYKDINKLFGFDEGNNPRVRCSRIVDKNKKASYWCPYMAFDGKATNSKWVNLISEDTQYIYEFPTSEKGEKRKDKYLTSEETAEKDNLRYTFGHVKNNKGEKYLKFLGVYKFERYDEKRGCAVFKKISDELDLSPFVDAAKSK